jgi:sortase A
VKDKGVASHIARTYLGEALLLVGLALVAIAGMMTWTEAHSEQPAPLAEIQPTPYPTATPMPSPTATATTILSVEALPTPNPLPTIPALPPMRTPEPASSPPTRIIIPSIGLDSKIMEVGWTIVEENGVQTLEWAVADYAVGFHRGSAYPGNPGNTVLSGHHNIRGKVFRYLVNVEPGDVVTLYVGDVPYYYRVESKQILPEKYASAKQRAQNAQYIGYFPDERLTMVTCWPYTSNTHRVIVIARPAPPPPKP